MDRRTFLTSPLSVWWVGGDKTRDHVDESAGWPNPDEALILTAVRDGACDRMGRVGPVDGVVASVETAPNGRQEVAIDRIDRYAAPGLSSRAEVSFVVRAVTFSVVSRVAYRVATMIEGRCTASFFEFRRPVAVSVYLRRYRAADFVWLIDEDLLLA